MRKTAGVICASALLVTAPLLWIGGEAHKRNCVEASRTGCSVMPWKDGTKQTPTARAVDKRSAIQREIDDFRGCNPFDGCP